MKRQGTAFPKTLASRTNSNRSSSQSSRCSAQGRGRGRDNFRRGPSRSNSLRRQSGRQGDAEGATIADLFFSGASFSGSAAAIRTSRASSGGPLPSQWSSTPEGPITYIMDPPEFIDHDSSIRGVGSQPKKKVNMKKLLVSEYWKSYAAFPDTWPWVRGAREAQVRFNDQVWSSTLGHMEKQMWANNDVAASEPGSLAYGIEPYVVMSPNKVGVRSTLSQDEDTKTGDVLYPGECVLVDSVVFAAGVHYLRLADTSTWVFARKGDNHCMSPMIDMETGLWWYRVVCKDFVEVRKVPAYGNRFRCGCILCPNEVCVVSVRCDVDGYRFLKLADGRGWVFEIWPNDESESEPFELVMDECGDWLLESDEEDEAPESPGLENEKEEKSQKRKNYIVETGLWQHQVLHRSILALGNAQNGVMLRPNEFIIIDKRVPANGALAKELEDKTIHNRIWLRLADGRGWIPKTDEHGEQTVRFIGLLQGEKPLMRNVQQAEENQLDRDDPMKSGIA